VLGFEDFKFVAETGLFDDDDGDVLEWLLWLDLFDLLKTKNSLKI
jgi:hypothetical protein